MKLANVRVGMRVETVDPELIQRKDATLGLLVHQRHLNARRGAAFGTVGGYVPGHGGDAWWVTHDDGEVGVYLWFEFREVVATAAGERAAVVAWLREDAAEMDDGAPGSARLRMAADAIERGDHRG